MISKLRSFYNVLLAILFIHTLSLQGQSFDDFRDIDKEIHRASFFEMNYDCSLGADISIFDNIIDKAHDSYYSFGAMIIIGELVNLAIASKQEEKIYEMFDKYNNLANQALAYGISNNYIHYKFISLFIKDFLEGYQSIENDLLTLADHPDIKNNPYKQFEIENYLWIQTKGSDKHEVHHEKIIELINRDQGIKNTYAYATYAFERSIRLIKDGEIDAGEEMLSDFKSFIDINGFKSNAADAYFNFLYTIIEYSRDPGAKKVRKLKGPINEIFETNYGILSLGENIDLLTLIFQELARYEYYEIANNLMVSGIDNWNMILSKWEDCLKPVIESDMIRDKMGLYMNYDKYKILLPKLYTDMIADNMIALNDKENYRKYKLMQFDYDNRFGDKASASITSIDLARYYHDINDLEGFKKYLQIAENNLFSLEGDNYLWVSRELYNLIIDKIDIQKEKLYHRKIDQILNNALSIAKETNRKQYEYNIYRRLGNINYKSNISLEEQVAFFDNAHSLIKSDSVKAIREYNWIYHSLLKDLNRFNDAQESIIDDFYYYFNKEYYEEAFESLNWYLLVIDNKYGEHSQIITTMTDTLISTVKDEEFQLLLRLQELENKLEANYYNKNYVIADSLIPDYMKLYKQVNYYDIDAIRNKYIRIGKSLIQFSAWSNNYDNHRDLVQFLEPMNWTMKNIEAHTWFIRFVDGGAKGPFNEELYIKYMNRILAYELSDVRTEKKVGFALNYYKERKGNYNIAIALLEEALLEANKLNNNNLELEILLDLGETYCENRQYSLGGNRLFKALQLSKYLNDSFSHEKALQRLLEWVVKKDDESYNKLILEYLQVTQNNKSFNGVIQALSDLMRYYNNIQEPDSVVKYMIMGFEYRNNQSELVPLEKLVYLSFLAACIGAIDNDQTGLLSTPIMDYHQGNTNQPKYVEQIYNELIYLKDFDYSKIDSKTKEEWIYVYINTWKKSNYLKEVFDNSFLQTEEFYESLDSYDLESSWGKINYFWNLSYRILDIEYYPRNDTYHGFGFEYDIQNDSVIVSNIFTYSPSFNKLKKGDLIIINESFEINRENVAEYFQSLSSKVDTESNILTILRNGNRLQISLNGGKVQPNPYSAKPLAELNELTNKVFDISETIFETVPNIHSYNSFTNNYREFLIMYPWRYYKVNNEWLSSDQLIDWLNKYESFSTFGLVNETIRHKEYLNNNPLLINEYNHISEQINDLQISLQKEDQHSLNPKIHEKRMNLYKQLNYFEKYNLDKEIVKHSDHSFSFQDDYKYFQDFDVIVRFFSTTILNDAVLVWNKNTNNVIFNYTRTEKEISLSIKKLKLLLEHGINNEDSKKLFFDELLQFTNSLSYGDIPIFSEEELSQKKRNVLVIPEGAMNSFPFELFLYQKEGDTTNYHYYTDIANITYAPSLSAYKEFVKRKKQINKKDKAILVSANPPSTSADLLVDNLLSLRSDFGDIKYVDNEISTINAILSKSKFLKRKIQTKVFNSSQITEESFLNSDLSTYNYIHIAAHGVHELENPNFSGILLGRNNNDKYDGILQSHEIFPINLNADLVTLSSCFSGFGEIDPNEGNLGIYRSFLMAGSKSVIISLWNVEDESTSVLFTKFYEYIKDGKSKSESLRLAKKFLRENTRFSDPFYWAPFVLIGEA